MMGKAIGATFNVDGGGPLHEGRALCAATLVVSVSRLIRLMAIVILVTKTEIGFLLTLQAVQLIRL